jgi:hypothetical protein
MDNIEGKRTTVILRTADQANLEIVSALWGASYVEAIRRSLKLTRELIEHASLGGSIILKMGRKEERVRFL